MIWFQVALLGCVGSTHYAVRNSIAGSKFF